MIADIYKEKKKEAWTIYLIGDLMLDWADFLIAGYRITLHTVRKKSEKSASLFTTLAPSIIDSLNEQFLNNQLHGPHRDPIFITRHMALDIIIGQPHTS